MTQLKYLADAAASAQTPLRSTAYWRVRVMYAMMSGYALFYFVRKNISLAAKPILEEFHLSNTDWGMILGVGTIVYALSKFVSGMAADRFSAKYMMSIGLFGAALANILFGFGGSFTYFLILWGVNQAFQGMGMPPCSRLLIRWFEPKDIGRAWGIWNASSQLGSAMIVALSGFLVVHYGWRSAIWVPAGLAIIGAAWIFERLVDTPEEAGLKSAQPAAAQADETPFMETLRSHILNNPWVWIVSVANFFVYFVRIGIVDWAPKYLQEARGFTVQDSAFAMSGFELAGILGAYAAGWISDVLCHSRRGMVAALFMLGLIPALAILFLGSFHVIHWIDGLFLVVGFFLYGPQLLIAVAAAEYASAKAASTAVGLTGLLGYFGASVCGITTGYLVDHAGWNAAVSTYVGAGVLGLILLLFTWRKIGYAPE